MKTSVTGSVAVNTNGLVGWSNLQTRYSDSNFSSTTLDTHTDTYK